MTLTDMQANVRLDLHAFGAALLQEEADRINQRIATVLNRRTVTPGISKIGFLYLCLFYAKMDYNKSVR
jgi:hypothetical protein